MAISFIDSDFSRDTSTATSVSPALPTGTAENDLMIATCIGPTTIATGTWSETGVGGWTLLYTQGETTGDDRTTAVFYKVAGASESAPTFDHGSSGTTTKSAMINTFRGIDTAAPLDVTFVQGSHYAIGNNTHNPTNPAITTVTANAWVIVIHFHTGTGISAEGAPSGYTLCGSVVGASHAHTQMQVARKLVASPGTETPGAWTNNIDATTNDNSLATLAIKPAAAAGRTTKNTRSWGLGMELGMGLWLPR